MQKTPIFNFWVGKIHWRRDRLPTSVFLGFPWGSAGKESACNVGDLGSIPGLGRSPGEGTGYPLQYSGLENSMDCIAHGVAKTQTWLSHFHFHFLSLSSETTSSSGCSVMWVGKLTFNPVQVALTWSQSSQSESTIDEAFLRVASWACDPSRPIRVLPGTLHITSEARLFQN